MYRFLSNVVAMPTSEAIVESWGSCIDHLHKNKPHTMEVTDGRQDLTSETGTVDKFAFIKLNGPPPGAARNVKILKAALNVMFKGNFPKHFIHVGNLNTTSKTVSIVRGPRDVTLPPPPTFSPAIFSGRVASQGPPKKVIAKNRYYSGSYGP